MSDRKLIEVGLADERWSEDAHWAVNNQWNFVEATEQDAELLRDQVLNGEITIQELRQGVVWANALDQEAVEMYGADLTFGEQQQERAARRLMHMAGRNALSGLRNARLRSVAYASRVATNQHFVGMGKFETHDIRDRNLVQ